MKALTIRQPWATLIALGVKTIETRSWRAPQSLIGQTIAIHAGKHQPEHDWPKSITAYTMWCDEFGERVLQRYWFTDDQTPGPDVWPKGYEEWPLPLGAIVATATLADCVPMIDGSKPTGPHWTPSVFPCIDVNPHDLLHWTHHDGGFRSVETQRAYGDFAPGRWAWMLTDVQPTTERCPACGRTPETPGMIRLKGPCDHCLGLGKCPPSPVKGKQGLWTVAL